MYPSYINNKSNNSFSTINQQWTTSSCYYNHEDPNFKPANMQSTIEKSSNNNGKFIVADSVSCFNMSHEILENNCLTGNRSSKKDRHSKINTVRGPRDRRMRLSLDVATKFFMLQDLLNFDKASNTIEWLLEKSKPAIRDLQTQQFNQSFSFMGVSNSQSSVSECEVLSGINDQSMEKTGDQDKGIIKEKKKIQRGVRKGVYTDHSLAKETREKARARARKRTTEKRKIKLFDYEFSKLRPSLDETMDQNTTPALDSWIPFGENQVQLTDPSSHDKRGIVGDIISSSSMVSTCNWSPSFLLGHQHNPA